MTALLLDIEGTVLPINYVTEKFFPYALAALPSYLSIEWTSPAFAPLKSAFEDHTPGCTSSAPVLVDHITRLSAQNTKLAPLKELQGLLWQRGYDTGDLRAPMYPDVAPALHSYPHPIYIFSSGSIQAQRLCFSHTTDGDLSNTITDYYDLPRIASLSHSPTPMTKRDHAAYTCIAKQHPSIHTWHFITDIKEEAEAASIAGMHASIIIRPGNAPISLSFFTTHPLIRKIEKI